MLIFLKWVISHQESNPHKHWNTQYMYNGKCMSMFTEAKLIEDKNWKKLMPTQTELCSSKECNIRHSNHNITIIKNNEAE